MANGLVDYLNDLRYVEVSNAGASTIPAFGLMRVTGASTTNGLVLTVDQPNTNGQDVLINGPTPIIAGGRGVATYETPSQIYYDTGDGTPANGETWGAGSGTYKLKKNKAGFTIHGGAANELVVAVREDQVNGAGTISSVPGCGLQADGSTWTVNTTDLVSGAYGLESLESCEIGVKLGCGLEFDESGNVQVKNTDMIGDGLTIGSGCELAAKLGCGLEFGDESEIKFNASDVVDGNYGLTTMGSCGIVAKLGCGMTFGTNGSLNVAASDIASGTLGGIVSGSGCTLAIDTTPATTYTLTYVSAVDLTLTGCTLELGKTLTSTRLVRNARGVVIGIADGGSVASTDQAVICACDCTGCIEVGGCSIPRTFDFPVSYSTASTSPPNDPDVVGCSVVAFGVTLTVTYNDIEEWWYGTCYLPDVDTTIEFWMRYNGTYWEAKFEGSRGHYTGGGDWFDITDGISCPDPVIISIYSAGADVGGAAEGTTWLASDVIGCYFNVYLSTFFDPCGG